MPNSCNMRYYRFNRSARTVKSFPGAGRISFYSYSPCMSRPLKQWLSIDDQIALLSSRGMSIADPAEARQWLSAVGYYRLSGYWYPFRQLDASGATPRRSSHFVPDTTFHEVVKLYEFDRHLKTQLQDGLERVEVAFRSQIGYLLGRYGPVSHATATSFRPTFAHSDWWNTAQGRIRRARNRDDFVDHHYVNYAGTLPIWVLTDVLDFSDLSKLYAGMRASDQKSIADWFAVTLPSDASKSRRQKWAKNPPLANWLEHLTVVRNICAHHGRLWNRQLTPIGTSARIRHLPVFADLPQDQVQIERAYGTICVVSHLLDAASPGHSWRTKIDTLIASSFAEFTHRRPSEMGIPNRS